MYSLRLVRSEKGIAMVLAITVMLIVLALGGALVVASTGSSRTTVGQQNHQVALEAAKAGVEAAVYRISAEPYNGGGTSSTILNQCFTTSFVTQPASGNCPGQTESLGSRGEYTYYVSPEMESDASCSGNGTVVACWTGHTTSSCTGYPVESTTPGVELSQRCVTSIGTYQGTRVRLQERIVDNAFTFPVSGLLSLSNILFDTNKPSEPYDGCPTKEKPPACPPVYLNGQFEANGTITLGGHTYKEQDVINGSIALGPKGSVSLLDKTYNCPAESLKYELTSTKTKVACTIPAVQTANYPWSSGAKLSDYTNSAKSNSDEAVNVANPTVKNKPYVASSRAFVVSSSNSEKAKPIVIPSGTYNFCSFEVNGGYVEVAAGSQVVIYIDNSTTGDGCGTGGANGELYMPKAGFLNQNANPQTLIFDVCGDVTGESGACGEWSGTGPEKSQSIGQVTLNDDLNQTGGPEGNGMTYGDIYAPDSYYTTTGLGLRWTGGLVAGNWESNDNDWIQGAPAYANNPTLAFYPVAFHICSSSYGGTDPSAGCY